VTKARRETRTEADMAKRYDTIKLRLPLGYKARLLRLAEEDGHSASDWVRTWIEAAEREIAGIKRRHPRKS
jgi:hypothetical protein